MALRNVVVAYDVVARRRRDRLFRYLSSIRMDGQKSVHELVLSEQEIPDVVAAVMTHIDDTEDKVLLCGLPEHRLLPRVLQLCGTPLRSTVLPAKQPNQGLRWHDHDYLVAYDVRQPRRLRRMQRVAAAEGIYLQRSVYLVNLSLARYETFKERVLECVAIDEDDVRLYPLRSMGDLYFLAGGTRSVYASSPEGEPTLLGWLESSVGEGDG